MADSKVSDLTAATSVAGTDLAYVVASSASRKITWTNLVSSISTLLGLGTIVTQNANNVSISGGSVTGITDLAVADGGTGASTAPNARTALGLVIGTDVLAPSGSGASLTGIYVPAGTDVALADGGTGASLADPNADRIMFWDDSAGQTTWLTAGTGLDITGTTLTATASGGNVSNTGTPLDNQIAVWTAATTVEGASNLTYDGRTLTIGTTSAGSTQIVMKEDTDNGTNTLTLTPPAALGSDITVTLPSATGTLALTSDVPTDAELSAIAGLTSASDRLPYFTGSGTAALATFTAAGRALVDDADAAAQLVTLGAQASDTELTAIAGLTSAADRLPYFTGSGTAALATFTSAGRALVDDADAAAQRTTLNIVGHAKQLSAQPDTSGQVFPFVVVGATNSRRFEGLGVTDGTTLSADRTWYLTFEQPNPLPAGTCKLNIWSRSLGTGNVIVNPKWASLAGSENPDTITLNAEGSTTIALSATTAIKTQITLDADTVVAGEMIVMSLVFEDTNNTGTAASAHQVSVIWE